MLDLRQGDCLDVMRGMDAESVDTILTDPPYGLSFMGKDWDHGVPGVRFWTEALRVAKPGALLLAFGGTRTYHRLTCAIEDAGWEIRDQIMWVYGSGFPKSHNISKAIDKRAGAEREVVGQYTHPATGKTHGDFRTDNERAAYSSFEMCKDSRHITAPATDLAAEWDGWGTALKPAWEPVIVAMKPIPTTFAENAARYGVAGMWIDGARIGTNDNLNGGSYGGVFSGSRDSNGNLPKAIGSGDKGRWPANFILGCACEGEHLRGCAVRVLGEQSGVKESDGYPPAGKQRTVKSTFGEPNVRGEPQFGRSTGTAARFFYCAKASRTERNMGLEGMPERQKYARDGRGGSHEIFTAESATDSEWAKKNPNHPQANHHPTVKPLSLMRYLARLTKTPTGGVVLDPFMGSGTTGMAAVMEGRGFIGIELEPDYVKIARARIDAARQEARQLELITSDPA